MTNVPFQPRNLHGIVVDGEAWLNAPDLLAYVVAIADDSTVQAMNSDHPETVQRWTVLAAVANDVAAVIANAATRTEDFFAAQQRSSS